MENGDKKPRVQLKRSAPFRRRQPYDFLRTNRFDLGRTATKAYTDVVEFLQKEIELPATNELLNSRVFSKPKQVNKQKKVDEKVALNKLVKRSHDVLATAQAVFPFDPFPDKVTVDRTKVTINHRTFFWSEQVMSIRIEDVLNVSINSGPFFASLIIASRVMSSEDHFRINYFWKSDAIHLKHIIQGYVIAQHNKIETSHLPTDELIKILAELGHDKNT